MPADKSGADYGCPTKTIPYMIMWNGIVMNYHKKYLKEITIADSVEIYIQATTLKDAGKHLLGAPLWRKVRRGGTKGLPKLRTGQASAEVFRKFPAVH